MGGKSNHMAKAKMERTYRLFVDDMRSTPRGWIAARTVSEAIEVLSALPIREISLDHDIINPPAGKDLYQALSAETFRGVARYVSLMQKRPKVRIHTANVGAAMSMCRFLRLPFNTTYKHFDEGGY